MANGTQTTKEDPRPYIPPFVVERSYSAMTRQQAAQKFSSMVQHLRERYGLLKQMDTDSYDAISGPRGEMYHIFRVTVVPSEPVVL